VWEEPPGSSRASHFIEGFLRPQRTLETSRTSGCEGRRHSNGRIRDRCQLDRRPAKRRRRPSSGIAPGRAARRTPKSLRIGRSGGEALGMAEPLIDRGEIIALLFNVADIATAAIGIETLLQEEENWRRGSGRRLSARSSRRVASAHSPTPVARASSPSADRPSSTPSAREAKRAKRGHARSLAVEQRLEARRVVERADHRQA
jgi:hypothetical protein